MHIDLALEVGDDPVNHGKAKTRAAPLAAFGEKRFKKVIASLDRDSLAVIRNLEDGPAGSMFYPDSDPPTAIADGVARVEYQVEEQPAQAHDISFDRNRLVLELENELYLWRQQMVQNTLLQLHQLHQIDGLGRRALSTGKDQQLAHHLGSLLRKVADRRNRVRRGVWLVLQQPCVEQDRREKIVEVVSHAAGQGADRLHLLRVAQPLLGIHRLGDVSHHQDGVLQPFGHAQRTLQQPPDVLGPPGPGSGSSQTVTEVVCDLGLMGLERLIGQCDPPFTIDEGDTIDHGVEGATPPLAHPPDTIGEIVNRHQIALCGGGSGPSHVELDLRRFAVFEPPIGLEHGLRVRAGGRHRSRHLLSRRSLEEPGQRGADGAHGRLSQVGLGGGVGIA